MISRTAGGDHDPVPARGAGTASAFKRFAMRVRLALSVGREDAADDGGLDLVDHAADVAAGVALVTVPVDATARDGAGLRTLACAS
jgi:hypothetical protein